MNALELKPSYWASVSGGKDSLLMLKMILENPSKYPLNGVVHFELEIDYPFIKDVINYMKKEVEKLGIPFVTIKPRSSWYDLYKKWGMPDRKARWCNSSYKLDALKQLKEYLNEQGYNLICYIGYCVDETNRYQGRVKNEIYPLVEENIVEEDVLKWARTVPLFNHYYETQRRCGCMFCPIASYIEYAYMLKYYPDKYDEFMSLCKESELRKEKQLGRHFSTFQSNPKYDANYVDNIVRTKWFKKLEELEVSNGRT